MAHAHDPEFARWIEAARAYPIEELANARGLRLRGLAEKSGPCPECAGHDRFNMNVRKGVWFCRQCAPKGGNVIDLVMHIDHCDFLRAVETLTGIAPPRGQGHGPSPAELAQIEIARAAKRAEQDAIAERFRGRERDTCVRWWRMAKPAKGSPVEDYLALRRVSLPPGALLRYRPEAKLWANGKRGAAVVHVGPAMIAAILRPDGVFGGLHTTWIDIDAPDGKALAPDEDGEFVPAKKVRGSARGGRIELQRHAEPRRLVIGEGIETTLSVRDDFIEAGRDLADFAFWAGISLDNLGGPAAANIPHPTLRTLNNRPQRLPGPVPTDIGIPIPDSVEEIVFLRDGDSDPFRSATTFARASARWARPGRTILCASAPEGSDFNDLRRGK